MLKMIYSFWGKSGDLLSHIWCFSYLLQTIRVVEPDDLGVIYMRGCFTNSFCSIGNTTQEGIRIETTCCFDYECNFASMILPQSTTPRVDVTIIFALLVIFVAVLMIWFLTVLLWNHLAWGTWMYRTNMRNLSKQVSCLSSYNTGFYLNK